MTLHSLPIFVRLTGRPVMLIGDGEAADAKRRLLERAGAMVVGEDAQAALAIVALDDPQATVARLKARGVLVNAVDRPDLCDFTLPAIVDRSPVIVAVGTGGVSAGLAAALRQRLEIMLPTALGELAEKAQALRVKFPDSRQRRAAISEALDDYLSPYLRGSGDPEPHVASLATLDSRFRGNTVVRFVLESADPDDLTLRQARALSQADRVLHAPGVPPAILDRARADAPRIVSLAPPVDPGVGLTVYLEMAR
ncbi:NAD(P)-dependent oxidoreductase [Sphingomonas bacterium]|uniref:precorrin-2 dehydrogenase/sirohydrochlorin ferrochelatase family protein n=1 Tax=Sphingomonas bacterium TaxID=1895847 RepID=UPI002627B0C9|nr:NAD(P)-dependent oxidoreductase [Sphingomonas bacterium]